MSTWVIKVGGALLESQSALTALFSVIKTELDNGVSIVMVHGGGSTVEAQLSQAGFVTEKLNGLRVSPASQMPIIAGALSGTVNKQLVCSASASNIQAVGLSLADGEMTTARIVSPELGCVADVSANNAQLPKLLVQNGMLPIISSIGQADGQLVNVNADDAAAAIAELLKAELIFLSDVPGVLDGNKDLIDDLDSDLATKLIAENVIQGGMTVKVNAALATASRLRRNIAVTSWKQPDSISEIIAGRRAGTRVIYSATH